MKIKGVDLEALGDQFENPRGNGKVLIIDADGFAYQAAAKAKKLDTAVRYWLQDVLTYQFLTGCEFIKAYLTDSKCYKNGRAFYPTVKPYQGNRNGKNKPALLETLRTHLPHAQGMPDCLEILLCVDDEADAYALAAAEELGDQCVVVSQDKDFRCTTAPYWDMSTQSLDVITDTYGWVSEARTEGGALKAKGHGRKFLWYQLLAGDQADHVAGLTKLDGKLCGTKKALEFLEDCATEDEAANKVLSAYLRNKQNPLAELEMVWLSTTTRPIEYLRTLNIHPKIMAYMEKLDVYHKQYLAAARERAVHE